MYIIHLISISYVTYIIMCSFLGVYEEITNQRNLAFYRSNLNFFGLYVLSRCIPFDEIPSTPSNPIITLILWVMVADTIFTITHRLLHTKHLYWIHKQHHQNNPSYSTSTFDSHFIEYLFGNVSTGVIPMLLIGGSDSTQLVWMIGANINTVLGHHMEGPHLTHHKNMKYNYGQGLYLWDKLFKTYKN